jgi:D-glycero-D-manno-heptose 1,7-bisphosphate phosphatase
MALRQWPMKADQPSPRPAAFLDRDGVVNVDHGYVCQRENFEFVPGVLDGARRLSELGFALVIVTNQSGIGRGLYTEREFHALSTWMGDVFAAEAAPLAGVYFCPHHPTDAIGEYLRQCNCRKPAPGMLLTAAAELNLDLAASVLFGDRAFDLEAARAAGVPRRVMLATDGMGEPAESAAPGLVTGRFRRLDEALANIEFLNQLKASKTAG